jgi:hypothetical protein
MRDPRGRGKRFRASRCVERRARVSNELRRQCHSLWRRRRYPRQALGEQTQLRLGFADGAARERDSSAPPRRSVRGAHGVLERSGKRTPPLCFSYLAGAEPELGIQRRVHAGGEQPVQNPASHEYA